MLTTPFTLNDIENEIIIGLAGGLGVDFIEVADELEDTLKKAGYHTITIRISENFPVRATKFGFSTCYWKMQYGTKQRQLNGNDYWARVAVQKIYQARIELSYKFKKIAYLIRSLKNKEEVELLANVYGRNFISMAIFCDAESSIKYLHDTLKLKNISIAQAQQEMQVINQELGLGVDVQIQNPGVDSESATLAKYLLHKDQAETHPDLKEYGQNLFRCYSIANYFIYQNKKLSQQIMRFINILFNDPFAEPTYEEYFMFCAQATAYRSLDLDRQVGAVIVNAEHELIATGFNDVSKVGGGHFAHHAHPMYETPDQTDERDFKQEYDYNHVYLDQIAYKIAQKLHLQPNEQTLLREEISGITEFKRSTHAEMSALLDASRRGISVRDCTMYVNTYPCHVCTKHIIASGIKKIVFLHPYTKSKAKEMYKNMLKHGIFAPSEAETSVVFEPFLGVSPNRFMFTFDNDKETRLERVQGKETGRPVKWTLNAGVIPRNLMSRRPHSYISREWVVVHNRFPDIAVFYKPGFIG